MSILQSFSTSHPKPAICEMGGKNPVIVAASADLDLAVEGTARAAFGFGGQKCSAASRVFVDESLVDEFVRPAGGPRRGDPADVGRSTGAASCRPSSTQAALDRYEAVVADARLTGEVLVRRRPVSPTAHLGRGNYVAPTVVRVPDDSMIWDDRAVRAADRGASRRRRSTRRSSGPTPCRSG